MPSAYIRPLSGDCQRFLIDGYLKGYIIEDDNKTISIKKSEHLRSGFFVFYFS